MNLPQHTHVFFIGIGGAGMSALAGMLKEKGYKVAGYDRSAGLMTRPLESLGIPIVHQEDVAAIPDGWNNPTVLVIYTPAIPTNSLLLNHFANQGNRIMKRAQLMGELLENTSVLAVAGTHGKTTTSALLIHLLNAANIPANALIGGFSVNLEGNFQSRPNATFTVAEADEFDRSFLTLKPYAAIFNSLDADHLDIYGTEEELKKNYAYFANTVKKDGFILTAPHIELDSQHPHLIPFGTPESGIYAENLQISSGSTRFTLIYEGIALGDFMLPMLGQHNVYNALAALTLCLKLGASVQNLQSGLAGFNGVLRRMQRLVNKPNIVYYDDYAHHPTEIDAAIAALRDAFPDRRILGLFQPHLFSRTRDFWTGFQTSLQHVDELILMDIYPARELPISGINSQVLSQGMTQIPVHLANHDTVLELVKQTVKSGDVVLSIGAGDIDRHCASIANHLNTLFS